MNGLRIWMGARPAPATLLKAQRLTGATPEHFAIRAKTNHLWGMAVSYGPPNRRFQQQLNRLSDEADDLFDALNAANQLPRNFPLDETEYFCRQLSGLKSGTSGMSGPQLGLAARRLAEIRFEHVEPEDPEDLSANEDSLTEYGPIDAKLGLLIQRIQNALAGFHAQAETEPSDASLREPFVSTPDASQTLEVEEASSDVIGRTTAVRTDLLSRAMAGRDEAEIMERRLQDAINLGWSAKAQLAAERIYTRWWTEITAGVQKIPALIENAGAAISRIADASEPLVMWWQEQKTNAIAGTIDAARGFGTAMAETGKRLGGPKQPTKSAPIPPRDEAAEAEVVRRMLAGERITPELGRGVRVLDFGEDVLDDEREIAHPEDLQHLPYLTELGAFWTNIRLADVLAAGPIAGNLTSLHIRSHGSEKLGGMEAFTALTSLTLAAHSTTNIDLIKGLTWITSLKLYAVNATNFDALKELTGITSLTLHSNSATNFDALEELTGITSLTLHSNSATSIDALKGLTGITNLDVWGRKLEDISAIAELTNLENLTLRYFDTTLETVPLAALPKLKKVSLSYLTLNTLTIPEGVEADIDESVKILDQM